MTVKKLLILTMLHQAGHLSCNNRTKCGVRGPRTQFLTHAHMNTKRRREREGEIQTTAENIIEALCATYTLRCFGSLPPPQLYPEPVLCCISSQSVCWRLWPVGPRNYHILSGLTHLVGTCPGPFKFLQSTIIVFLMAAGNIIKFWIPGVYTVFYCT